MPVHQNDESYKFCDRSAGKAGKYAGGNSAVIRPKPEWQKSIGDFLKKASNEGAKETNDRPAEMDEHEEEARDEQPR